MILGKNMNNRIINLITFMIILVNTASCRPTTTEVVSTPTVDQTRIAREVEGTITAYVMSVQPTPRPTLTPSLTPLPSLTPTPQKVTGTVMQDSACRSCPDEVYDLVDYLHPGDQIELQARSADNSAWYIPKPGDPQAFCWLAAGLVNASGDPETLPVYTPMPSPTPIPPDFGIKYIGYGNCVQDGKFHLSLNIINTGSTVWQMMYVKITDTLTGKRYTLDTKTFVEYLYQCQWGGIYPENLFKGATAHIGLPVMDDDPKGHLLLIDVTLCENEINRYPCLTRSIEVTP